MSSIPPNPVVSIAQAALSQAQRASEADATREADARRAVHQNRLHGQTREFVEDMIEATGLKVDPDGQHERETKRRKFHQDHLEAAGQSDDSVDSATAPASLPPTARSHSAALLASPDDNDKPAPPPYLLDIRA